MTDDTTALARRIRAHSLRMTHAARASHVGSCLSMADILAVLYGTVLRHDPAQPSWSDRDRLIVSKGHAAAAVYAVLAERGFLSIEELSSYSADGGRLSGHVTSTVPGVEMSTGSLGHGLPVAAGLALASKRGGKTWRAFCILSDGELNEGSNWEAVQFAQHQRLENLVAIVDYNKLQSFGRVDEVSGLHPLPDKFRAFNWGVHELDGHNHEILAAALTGPPPLPGRPTILVAHTVKGKGVSFMENDNLWHYRNADDAGLAHALAEIGTD